MTRGARHEEHLGGAAVKSIHKHRPVLGRTRVIAWQQCVTPRSCAIIPGRREAHGDIERREFCECGAVRKSEINNGRTNKGIWIEPEEEKTDAVA